MHTTDLEQALAKLWRELADGDTPRGASFILNSGDVGLLRSLDALSAEGASRSVNGGATIAAHALHLSFGLGLMNAWMRGDKNAFDNPKWDEAWKTKSVDDARWAEIRKELRDEAKRWEEALRMDKELSPMDMAGVIASIAHLAYHMGAIRQIDKGTRGPREGTFVTR